MASGMRALVTGGQGFLGGRLVEVLRDRGHQVRIASSNPRAGAADVVRADLSDHEALARAAEGCDVIFHLAYAFGGSAKQQHRLNVEGTMALARAATAHGARRFVHVGSVAAYGSQSVVELDETTTARPEDTYARVKHKIDQQLLTLQRVEGCPVTILQPTIVYGPRGGTWTLEPLRQVTAGQVVLPARGQGICNAVFVDDVVEAALLAADRPEAVGQAFLVSGAEPVTWGAFYGSYARMAGVTSVEPLDDGAFDSALAGRYGANPKLQRYRRGIEKVLTRLKLGPRGVAWFPNPALRELYASTTRVDISKAKRMLGLEPKFDLDRGMAVTAAWAREHDIVGPAD